MPRLYFDKETDSFTCPICGNQMTLLIDNEYECDYCGATGEAETGTDGEPSYMDFDEEKYYEQQEDDAEYDEIYMFEHE